MEALDAVRKDFARSMCDELGIRSSRMVDAFSSVRREDFVGPGPWMMSGGTPYRRTPDADPRHLYADVLVALDADRELNNGRPYRHARWLDALGVETGDRVVHLGAGTGYYTAILRELAGNMGRVTAVERDPGLLGALRKNLGHLSEVATTARVTSRLFAGASRAYINCALTRPPVNWLERMRDGGSMILPLTEMGPDRHGGVFVVRRRGSAYQADFLGTIRMFPCSEMRFASDEPLIADAFQRGGENLVRSLRVDRHAQGPRCWLHLPSGCLSEHAPEMAATRELVPDGASHRD